MKPEANSKRLFAIARSKGKMYEFSLPENVHLIVPQGSEPERVLPLAVATLGDAAAALNEEHLQGIPLPPGAHEELEFAAKFFDAFLESRLGSQLSHDTALLAASAYYLGGRPGSSLVIARKIAPAAPADPLGTLLLWLLQARWANYPPPSPTLFGELTSSVARLVAFHFYNGSDTTQLVTAVVQLRALAYSAGSARDLLFADLVAAIAKKRVKASAWTTLPMLTGLTPTQWAPAIAREHFPKELWPSQLLMGEAGMFSGASGVVQMPTSAGKTRSIEIVLRSAFLAGRARLAVVVAPFRALCHEISNALSSAFRDDSVQINELSDVPQYDLSPELSEIFGRQSPEKDAVLVVTPEKLLYLLRQSPDIVSSIGVVIYDEGHQFDTGSRGVTYELLLTEIKALLPQAAQTILVSAVISNAQQVGIWLLGADARVVNGAGLLTTARAVAFASWLDRLGQLMFFDSREYEEPDYFVPRVLEQHELTSLPGDRVKRFFPQKDNARDNALYLGISLVPSGAVALFCGRKDTAAGIAARAVEVYSRGFDLASPAHWCDPDELRRLKVLIAAHFGEASTTAAAAALGVFVHHGTTPHGIRLSIEYAMQAGKIRFVACTSTLAQGVNLPIRYLVVSGVQQGAERLKVRDFQNLLGRAGRSGMHTEGLVIFSDTSVYDERRTWGGSRKFAGAVELLTPERSEETTSSLLSIVAPLESDDGRGLLALSAEELSSLIYSDTEVLADWCRGAATVRADRNFSPRGLLQQIVYRRRLTASLESYLMANRGAAPFAEFREAAASLAQSTLAYQIAPAETKPQIVALFAAVADFVNEREPASAKQAAYAHTLLGVTTARTVEAWVDANRDALQLLDTNEAWLAAVWPLLTSVVDEKFFQSVTPSDLPFELAVMWLNGAPYFQLFDHARARGGKKPWGEVQRRFLSEDDIVKFCESTLSFDCALIMAAVAQFLAVPAPVSQWAVSPVGLFLKSLKYGLPSIYEVACYEAGFSDRVLAQHICAEVGARGLLAANFADHLDINGDVIESVLSNYPTYFASAMHPK